MKSYQMKIGTFVKNNYGETNGKIQGLGIGSTPVIFEPTTSKGGVPYAKIIADPLGDAYEVGAAFEKVKDNLVYYAVTLDTPAFAAPINAALFPDEDKPGHFNLVWNRSEQATPKAEAGQTQRRPYVDTGAGMTP